MSTTATPPAPKAPPAAIVPPITPPAPAAPAAPAKPTPIPNRAASRFETARESMGLGKKKALTPPVADPNAPPAPAAPAAVAPPTVPPVKPKPAAPVPAPVIDTNTITTAVVEGVREAMRPAAPAAAVDEAASLSPDMKRRYAVIQRMAKLHPELEAKPKEFLDSAKKIQSYQAEWESKNAGKKFNIQDDDHSEFLGGVDVELDDFLFNEALADIRADSRVEEVEKKFGAKFQDADTRERERNAIPHFIAHRATAAKVLFNELGPEFEKVLDAAGNISGAEIQSLIDKNPEFEEALPFADKVESLAGELFRIAHQLTPFILTAPPNANRKQLETVAIHNEIVQFVTDEEAAMMEQPADKRRNEHGMAFAPTDEFSKMSPEEKAKHWHFTDSDLSALYAVRQAKIAKEVVEKSKLKFEKTAKARGFKPAEAVIPATPATQQPPAPPTPAKVAEPSPSGITAPRMAPSNIRAVATDKPLRSQILGR